LKTEDSSSPPGGAGPEASALPVFGIPAAPPAEPCGFVKSDPSDDMIEGEEEDPGRNGGVVAEPGAPSLERMPGTAAAAPPDDPFPNIAASVDVNVT
jgi:hypothetical protein